MSTTPDTELLLRKVKAKGVRKGQLASLAQKAGLWDGKAKTTVTELQKRLLAIENLDLVWPHHHLLPEPKPDVEHLKTLREALDNSTRVNRTLGLSFVALMFYILLIITSTTDLMIFLPESTVHLPIIDVDLPLIGFYSTVPFIVLVIHFNLLMNLKHHQQKYRLWRDAVGAKGDSNLLDPILINFLDAYGRGSPLRLLLILMISTSIFYFPLINLILLQWRFSDYHSFSISSWQFVITLADVGLVLGFFYNVFYRKTNVQKSWRRVLSVGHWPTYLLVSISVFVWMMALCLQVRLHNPRCMSWFLSDQDLPAIRIFRQGSSLETISESALLHFWDETRDITNATRKAGLLSFRPLDLWERDLRFAHLSGMNLVGADLTLSNLDGVSFENVRLDGASLLMCELEGARLKGASLYGADLTGARIANADLSRARMEGAILTGANLSGSNLEESHLEGANLSGSRIIAANLNRATLVGANLENTEMYGSTLIGASLQGSNLCRASTLGADFSFSKMRGVEFDSITFYDGVYYQDIDWVETFDLNSMLELGSDLKTIDFRTIYADNRTAFFDRIFNAQNRVIADSAIIHPLPLVTQREQCDQLTSMACGFPNAARYIMRLHCTYGHPNSSWGKCLVESMCSDCPEVLYQIRDIEFYGYRWCN
jgi:uncharacterized protein YjbI with pentapeptide repeats